MLKRIKVRGKLLLLLVTPLVALVAFAYSGIVDRTDRTTFLEGEARIAELADAGTDLSLAIQIERIRVLEVERLGSAPGDAVEAERAETDEQLERWLDAVESTRGDVSDPQLLAELEDLADRLPTTISPERGNDSVTGTLLASAGRAVDEVTVVLAGEADDLDLFRALTDLSALISVQSSHATITSVGSEAILQGELTAVGATLIADAERTAQNSIDVFKQSARPAYVQGLERLENSGVLPNPASGPIDTVAEVRDAISASADGGAQAWLARGETQLTSLNSLGNIVVTDATDAADREAAAANDEARSFAVLAGAVVLLALTMAVIIGRSISRPLSRLTRSAEQLSTEELPALVESMHTAGRTEIPQLTPIESKGRDEVAQLARAISEIQQVTIDVAEEQGDLLRRGISDIFVNLARRNQSLLDRQIDFIDQLESREENPDQLENLFRLDHLATRMRRNAESLLVLAGAEPTRRRGRPVEIVDVLRVAMGEIEDFSRIRLMSVDSSTVAGSVAIDLAHLMSELMENATQFSPPDSPVETIGERAENGSYRLTLTDRGIGMSAEQLAIANRTLAEPPLVGLDLSRSLGFTVVSRLAHRLGVVVTLSAGADGGVTAVVAIPAEMIGPVDDASEPDAPAAELAPVAQLSSVPPPPPPPPPPAPVRPVDAERDGSTPAPVNDRPAPSRDNPWGSPATMPAADDDDSSITPALDASADAPAAPEPGIADLPVRRPAPPPPIESGSPPGPPADAEGDLFAAFSGASSTPPEPSDPGADLFSAIGGAPTDGPDPGIAEPTPATPPEPRSSVPDPLEDRDPATVGATSAQVTSAGLTRRTPKRVDVPEESKYGAGAPTPTPEVGSPTANRSPEEVRQMLSRYRAGLRKGRPGEAGPHEPTRRS